MNLSRIVFTTIAASAAIGTGLLLAQIARSRSLAWRAAHIDHTEDLAARVALRQHCLQSVANCPPPATLPQITAAAAPIIQPQIEAPKLCAFAALMGEDLEIPSKARIDIGQNSYHQWNLILSMLSQNAPQDILTRIPISEEIMARLALSIGITPAAFAEIWTAAEESAEERIEISARWTQEPIETLLAETARKATIKTDCRFAMLNQLLTRTRPRSGQHQPRQDFLAFARTNEGLRSKFPD